MYPYYLGMTLVKCVCGLLKTYRVCQCKRTVEASSTHKLKTVAYLKGQLYLIHDF